LDRLKAIHGKRGAPHLSREQQAGTNGEKETPWSLPDLIWTNLSGVEIVGIVSMVIVMLITAVETTGDVFATGEIVKKTIHQQDIARALRADGLSTLLGGILNSFPYTCFAENIGLVRLTASKVALSWRLPV
jgi:xanthine/uracil permease